MFVLRNPTFLCPSCVYKTVSLDWEYIKVVRNAFQLDFEPSEPSVLGTDGRTCVTECLLGTEWGLEWSNSALTFKSINGITGKGFNASLFTLY